MFGLGKKNKYGILEVSKTYIKVKAPSGEEALRIAGMDGKTISGGNYISANHQGNGIYYIEIEKGNGKYR